MNLKTKSMTSLNCQVFFFLRRLLYSFSIVFFGSYSLLQASLMTISSLALLMYMILVRPFKEKVTFYFEVFNEITLLAFSYFLIIFCDILIDSRMRYDIGWYVVIMTLLNVFINWLNLMASVIYTLVMKIKAKMAKKSVN